MKMSDKGLKVTGIFLAVIGFGVNLASTFIGGEKQNRAMKKEIASEVTRQLAEKQ